MIACTTNNKRPFSCCLNYRFFRQGINFVLPFFLLVHFSLPSFLVAQFSVAVFKFPRCRYFWHNFLLPFFVPCHFVLPNFPLPFSRPWLRLRWFHDCWAAVITELDRTEGVGSLGEIFNERNGFSLQRWSSRATNELASLYSAAGHHQLT